MEEVGNMSWGEFKPILADAVVAHLEPLQAAYREVIADPTYLDEVRALLTRTLRLAMSETHPPTHTCTHTRTPAQHRRAPPPPSHRHTPVGRVRKREGERHTEGEH